MAKVVKPLDARAVFAAAGNFSDASKALEGCLDGRFAVVPTIRGPMCVIAAFTIELYFKCLLADLGQVIPRSHNLGDLFKALPTREKKLIRQRYKRDKFHKETLTVVAKHGRNPKDYELSALLRDLGNNFEDWRYHFEEPKKKLRVGNWAVLEWVLRRVILKRHPDWGVDEEKFSLSTYPNQ